MPKQKGAVNKSAAIREILAKNPETPVKEIVSTLAVKGIKVHANLVYLLKAKAKQAKRKQVRKKVANTTGDANPFEFIRKVKGLAEEAGGLGKLKQLVDILAE